MILKAFKPHHYILIASALILNASGFIFRLFVAPGPYDEIAHAFTPFVITYCIYALASYRYKQVDIDNSIPLLLSIACVSVTLCVLWEFFEWGILLRYFSTDPTYSLDDTVTDLLYGTIGSSFITLAIHIKQQVNNARAAKKGVWKLSPQQAFEHMLKQNENTY